MNKLLVAYLATALINFLLVSNTYAEHQKLSGLYNSQLVNLAYESCLRYQEHDNIFESCVKENYNSALIGKGEGDLVIVDTEIARDLIIEGCYYRHQLGNRAAVDACAIHSRGAYRLEYK